jgi:cytochrome P450
MERLAIDLLRALPQREPFDLVTTFTRPLCMNFIAAIYGVPADEANEFPNWENALLTGRSIAEIEEGGRRCYEFALRMIETKRSTPGDDVFSKLLRSHIEDRHLDADELASTYIVLMIGAGETSNAMASGLLLLLSNRQHLSAIRADPEVASKYVEEILRYESPFRLLPPRFSDEPVHVDGVAIPKGEMITVCPAAANRDPSHFPHPDRFEPTEVSKDHLAFGLGEHKCLGSQLARMEMEVALRAFANYGEDLFLESPPGEAHWRAGDFMRRLDKLVVMRRPESSG